MRDASAALMLLTGCAGSGALREDTEPLRAEIRALRRENDVLASRVEVLSGRVDLLTARATRTAPGPRATAETATSPAPELVVPPDLVVVKVKPLDAARPSPRPVPPARLARVAPPVPTAVPISEPEPERLDALVRGRPRPIAVEADGELRTARGREGLDRAHALEDFTTRYPRHPHADNALVEAAAAYAEAGRQEAGCALASRAVEEYPAGDAMSDALERLARCEARRAPEAERRVLERLVAEYPGTPAAQRAGARLSSISGSAGEPSPGDVPARSGP